MRISPDGKYVAFCFSQKDMMCVATMEIDTQEIHAMRGSSIEDVGNVYWASDEHVVFDLYSRNNYAAGLYAAKRGKTRADVLNGNEVVRIIDPLVDDPDYILAWVEVAHSGRERLVKYNLKNGGARDSIRESKFDGKVLGWFTDSDGGLIGVTTYTDQNVKYLFRGEDGKTWEEFFKPKSFARLPYRILHADWAKREIWLCGYLEGNTTASLHTYDMDSGKLSEPIFHDEKYDIIEDMSLYYCSFKKAVTGMNYIKRYKQIVWFDADYIRMQAIVDRSFPGTINSIVSVDRASNRIVVYSYSDREPGTYNVIDLQKRAIVLSVGAYRGISEEDLAEQLVLKFKRPGGIVLEGFLTLPGPEESGPYPLIALPHGGPWARDVWGYDSEVQFLANRGYAVLQLNFRGSSGYSTDISAKYEGDFKGMVEDVIAATKECVDMGLADADRLAIMGASFGGYVAAAAASFEPNLYQCAISMMGVFDLSKQVDNWKRSFWRSRMGTYAYDRWVDALGDPESNSEYLQSISPQYLVDKVTVPVMLIHGRSDKVVAASQSKRYARALSAAGNKPKTHYFNWESHGLSELKNRIKAYEAIEVFLKENLKTDG
ncbi:MAG: alpha/beta fold hydrolase [Verrucomicrobiota bacterium]